jgi:glycosyltransferase involved in cell wall biosynthesis
MSAPLFVGHVPMPLARSGSAVTNVVRALVSAHARTGGSSAVVMSANRDGDVADADVRRVDYTRYCRREFFTQREYAVDHAAGMVGLQRPHMSRLFIPAAEAFAARPRPDVVIVHEGHYAASALPRFRKSLPDVQLGYYVHTPLSRAYSQREARRVLSYADHIICVSRYMADHVGERTGGRHPEVSVVLNGVDAETFSPPAERVPGERLRLLFVGQVAPHKGAHLLVEAVSLLPPQLQRLCEVRVVGSSVHGPHELTEYERSLRTVAATTEAAFDFRPFVENSLLPQQYGWADVVAVPSVFQDPCPLVVLEAMACGAAILATRAGGIPEIAGSAAVLCDTTGESLSEGLAKLLHNRDRVADLAGIALARARSLDWDSRMREVAGVFA